MESASHGRSIFSRNRNEFFKMALESCLHLKVYENGAFNFEYRRKSIIFRFGTDLVLHINFLGVVRDISNFILWEKFSIFRDDGFGISTLSFRMWKRRIRVWVCVGWDWCILNRVHIIYIWGVSWSSHTASVDGEGGPPPWGRCLSTSAISELRQPILKSSGFLKSRPIEFNAFIFFSGYRTTSLWDTASIPRRNRWFSDLSVFLLYDLSNGVTEYRRLFRSLV